MTGGESQNKEEEHLFTQVAVSLLNLCLILTRAPHLSTAPHETGGVESREVRLAKWYETTSCERTAHI